MFNKTWSFKGIIYHEVVWQLKIVGSQLYKNMSHKHNMKLVSGFYSAKKSGLCWSYSYSFQNTMLVATILQRSVIEYNM